ncbi:MAG TPA: ABC transporter permease, partial [Dehalococcoidia bacterium]|nr:ABC transporter permease [Dehalococcoidia bacterium]
ALRYFGVEAFDDIYERLAGPETPESWARHFQFTRTDTRPSPAAGQALAPDDGTTDGGREPSARGASGHRAPRDASRSGLGLPDRIHQWWALTRRSVDMLRRNPHHLVPLFATPMVITVLLCVLYGSGAFRRDVSSPMTPPQLLFFLGFSAFFFGLSYGAHAICEEIPIFRRERQANIGIAPYVFSKIAVLLPVLVLVMLIMLGVLRLTGRLPDAGVALYARLALTLVLTAFAGLSLGLLASAAVKAPEQASIVLPGLILPQVLFSGVLLPVPMMGVVATTLSRLMAIRWAFEAMGKSVGLSDVLSTVDSPLGRPLLAQYGDSFSGNEAVNWLVLAAMSALFLVATHVILTRKGASR